MKLSGYNLHRGKSLLVRDLMYHEGRENFEDYLPVVMKQEIQEQQGQAKHDKKDLWLDPRSSNLVKQSIESFPAQ
jgi:hypothetical protein